MRFLVLISLLVACVHSAVQSDECSCVPPTLTFSLNTTAGCTQGISKGSQSGISDSFCLIRESKIETDLIPVTISTIKIFELKQDLSTVGYPTVIRDVSDGDMFDFLFTNQTNTSYAGGIQFMVKGVNSNGKSVTQDSIVAFTNDCSSLVFFVGDQIGFLTVDEVEKPSGKTCPAIDDLDNTTASLSDSYSGGCKNGKSCGGGSGYTHNSDSSGCKNGSGGKGCGGTSSNNGGASTSGTGCKGGNCGDHHFESFSYSYSYSYSYSQSYNIKPKPIKVVKVAPTPQEAPKKEVVVETMIVKRVAPKTSSTKSSGSMSYPRVAPKTSSTKSSGSMSYPSKTQSATKVSGPSVMGTKAEVAPKHASGINW